MKLKIFFSWQIASDTKHLHNKPFILSCIGKAIGEIENKGELKGVWFEVQEGTSSEAGTPEMIATCEKRIDECHIFIADFTVERRFCRLERGILSYGGKKLREHQNTNVAYEFGRASHRLPTEQIITVMNTVNGSPEEDDKRFLAIDFRHRRWPILFHLTRDKGVADTDEAYDKAEKGLVADLKTAIQSSALAAIEHMDEQVKPFVRWEVQRRGTSFGGKFFWNDQLQAVQRRILENKKVLRLLGLSGMGKTHLVNEAFGGDNYLKTHYLYIDCYSYEYNDFRARLDWLFTNYREAYLVFDNCDQDLLRKIINRRRELQGTNPILTVYNDPMEESSGGSTAYLRMERAYDDIVENILSELPSPNSQLDRDKIKDFSGGVPMIARLLVQGIKNEQGIGLITDASLMDKILGVKKESEERAVLQALSLFSFVGYRDELADQMAFIAKHRLIATVAGDDERRVAVFDRTIQSYLQRGIIEAKGRLVGIRPTPIALFLFREWLSDCSSDRLYWILKDIQASPFASPLTEAFCAQFRYMGKSARARQLLAEVAGPTSSLACVKEVFSEQGSRLFRSLVEVDPEVVAQTLETVIGGMRTEELGRLSEGLSNIIWTIEKLCFEPSTFTRGAQMLLRLAAAQVDLPYGSNVLDSFTRLFPVFLPATAASLTARLSFLKALHEQPDQQRFLVKALSRVMQVRSFDMCGAEVRGLERLENYRARTNEEIEEYLRGGLDLLLGIIKQNPSLLQDSCRILSRGLMEWSQMGKGMLIWPYVLELAEYLNYDWDEMCDSLCWIVTCLDRKLPEEFLQECQGLINKLTKTDFFSRYTRVQDSYRSGLSHKENREKWKLDYTTLAKEMAKEHLYTVEMLVKIYGERLPHNYQFGSTVAESLSASEQHSFITNSIEALNAVEQSNTHTLIDFLRIVEEDLFAFAFGDMRKLHNKSALFACVVARGYPLDHPYVEELFRMVREGYADVEQLKNFYPHYPVKGSDPEGVHLQLLRRISQLPESLPIVLELGQSMLLDIQERNPLVEFLEDLLLNSVSQLLDYANECSLSSVIEELLHRGASSRLASALCQELMTHYFDRDTLNLDVPKCIRLLLSKHFDDVWPVFSIALLGEEEKTNQARSLLRLDMFRSRKIFESLLQDPSREAKVLKWCDEHPDRAPASIMSMLPLYNEEGDRFSVLVMELLRRYGDQEEVLCSLDSSLGTYSWSGSIIPLYEKQLSCVSQLMDHPIEAVSVWAHKSQKALKSKIEKEKKSEEEMEAGYR